MTAVLTFSANFFMPIALLIFALGFFPYKAFIPDRASFTAEQAELAQNAPFDKIIFMVVDALRRFGIFRSQFEALANVKSDFVYSHGSGFLFTQRCACSVGLQTLDVANLILV